MLNDFDPDAPASPSDGLFGLPHGPDDAAVVIVPVPFEATTSYGRGTARAPARILEASRQVELNDDWFDEPWRRGVAMLPIDPGIEALNEAASELALPIVEAGGAHTAPHRADLQRVNEMCEQLNQWVYEQTRAQLERGKIPGVLGGDHAVSFGAIQAAAERHPDMGILHIDAHPDLREAYEGFTWSHASVMYNVHERIGGLGHTVQVGVRDISRAGAERIEAWGEITAFSDHELAWELASGEPWMRIAARIVRPLPKKVWISFDIDGLDPSNCPNTGTPVPGGLTWHQALLLLQLLSTERRIVGFDLVEVGDGAWDADVGARLLYKLSGCAMKSG